MVTLTRREWESRVLLWYRDEPCPRCGNIHRSIRVDEWGVVWMHCPRSEQEYCLGTEPVPEPFALEPDDAEDLPF